MEEGPALARTVPNFDGAILATTLASDILNSARENFKQKIYDTAFEESKNSIRAAASALLIADGYIASTFESTYDYLLERYPDLPLSNWEMIENWNTRGLFYMLLKSMGIIKTKQQAKEAITTAEEFLASVGSIIGVKR
ncbi:HEPN domain-containing protein [Candidatus Micrarchaeota archaeon]|nr:HEPN domain-containing protein [Candidatus Micrarchaeota archaeon]